MVVVTGCGDYVERMPRHDSSWVKHRWSPRDDYDGGSTVELVPHSDCGVVVTNGWYYRSYRSLHYPLHYYYHR